MRIELIRRPERSRAMAWLSPVIAVGLTLVAGAIVFAASGIDPLQDLYVYFLEPLTLPFTLYELVVKAIPIVIVAQKTQGTGPFGSNAADAGPQGLTWGVDRVLYVG